MQGPIVGSRRRKLAEELRERDVPVYLHAPAGYGKSTFVNILRSSGVTAPVHELRPIENLRLPQNAALVGPDDLALDDEEVAMLFADLDVPDRLLVRVQKCARGWPIAALYFRRLAELGSLERALDDYTDASYDDLFEYIYEQVLSCKSSVLLRDHPLVRAALHEPLEDVQHDAGPGSGLRIELFAGRVMREGSEIPLPAREAGVLFTLAAHAQRAVEGRRLAQLLWPQLNQRQAHASLKITVHRLRSRLGDASTIAFSRGRYELSPQIAVDAALVEHALERPSTGNASLRVFLPLLECSRPPRLREADWFVAIEAELVTLAHRLAQRVADEAFARDDAATVLQVGRALLAGDPCDEEGCLYVLRALALENDLERARHEYERFSERLRGDLGCEPSFTFECGTRAFE